jgi:hypothetical protein
MSDLNDLLERAKRDVVRGIVDSDFVAPNGDVPQREIAKNVDMPSSQFIDAINDLTREKVLGSPQYDPMFGIHQNFNEGKARERGYL